jgi:hypothetical protein
VTDIDQMLRRLSAVPVHPGLATIDDSVLAGLAASRREAAVGSRLMGFAAALALVVGLASGGLIGAEPALAQPISPFVLDTSLTPSTLLDVRP